jgi:two-component system LytT family response regulator
MPTAVIVDDEEKNREALAKMLDQFCHDVQVVAKAKNAAEAKDVIERDKPDIVFLDIEMPGGDGFSLLESFDRPNFHIIFTTAHAAYAIKAIKFAALDYLLKPINLNELKIAVEKAVNMRITGHDEWLPEKIDVLKSNRSNSHFDFKRIALPNGDGIDFYDIKDILRCEADRSYCKFYLDGGKEILISRSMGEFEDLLNECNFFRVHKSHMVNLHHIKKYVRGTGGYVILSDNSHVDVSIRRKDELMQVLAIK